MRRCIAPRQDLRPLPPLDLARVERMLIRKRHAGAEHGERTVAIEPAPHRHSLLVAADGAMLAVGRDGGLAPTVVADDAVVWDPAAAGYRHAASGRTVAAAADGTVAAAGRVFRPCHGPEAMPSAYLRTMREQGWVCIGGIIAPEVVDGLQRAACTDAYAHRKPNRATPQFSQSPALGRTAAEPVSLWIVRQYMGTEDVRFAHTPALIVLAPDDGERNVQGWHSDYPYHWGVPAPGQVAEGAGGPALGVQRNVCVSAFTKERGATAFKLGSHACNHGPPTAWGTAAAHAKPGYRAAHGLPYGGPEADVIEAPAGSIILYDSRTWHRAGVNRSGSKRAAMLQAMTPMFVSPKNDTSQAYRHFLQSRAHAALSKREQDELRRLLVHRFIGPQGAEVITGDKTLTALFASP